MSLDGWLSLRSLEIKEKKRSLPDWDGCLFCFVTRLVVKPNMTSAHIQLCLFIMTILSFIEILIFNRINPLEKMGVQFQDFLGA